MEHVRKVQAWGPVVWMLIFREVWLATRHLSV
jgi:hypothetical protein